jgi:hypothetical protein
VGFVVNKAEPGQVFSEYFGFLCQAFHRLLHTHLSLTGAGSVGHLVASVDSVSPHLTARRKKKCYSNELISIRVYLQITFGSIDRGVVNKNSRRGSEKGKPLEYCEKCCYTPAYSEELKFMKMISQIK